MKEMIIKIIEQCEEIQHSYESDYTKERAKIEAYEDIRDLIMEDDADE